MLVSKPLLLTWLYVVAYYTLRRRPISVLARKSVAILPWTAEHPFIDTEYSARFIFAALSQFAFCAALIFVSGMSLRAIGFTGFRPLLLLCGAVLGLGELALGSFICHAGMRIAMALAPTCMPFQLEQWLSLLRAGWMREIVNTVEVAPPLIAGGAIALYILAEEVIFRGVLVGLAVTLGAPYAIISSTLLFAFVQTLGMPSWRNSMFPVVGALVTGIVHGILFVLVPDILPLVVAHFVLFVIGVL